MSSRGARVLFEYAKRRSYRNTYATMAAKTSQETKKEDSSVSDSH
jgi:hypothetical protein